LEKIKTANPEATLAEKRTFKGVELQGLDGIHYRQNSLTGEIIARRSTREVVLNTELH
jgi:2,3,4,5-tetrahydropyridine-2-carboxylate N-succinyltransferase